MTTSLFLILAACGGAEHPTGPLRVVDRQAGEVAAHQWTCWDYPALDDNMTARVAPPSLILVLCVGRCNAPGDALAASWTGTLVLDLTAPWGIYSIQVGNPPGDDVGYSLEVAYSTPSV